jgi:hypothetical protein
MSTSESSHTPATQPWSSGRTLTQSQREAKRRKDRITKRAKAEKQKDELGDIQNQIKDLWDLIDARTGTKTRFPHQQPGQNVSHVLRTPGACTSCARTNVPPHRVCPESRSSIELPDPSCDMNTSVPMMGEAPFQVEQLYEQFDPEPRRQRPGDWLFEISAPCSFSPQLSNDASYTIVRFTNNLLLKVRDLSRADICTSGPRSDDAIIRGVLEGWHTLRDTTRYCCPLWVFISQVDECIFIHSGLLTRLTMLSTIHTMLVVCWQISSLPSFYMFSIRLLTYGNSRQLSATICWTAFPHGIVLGMSQPKGLDIS